MPALLECVTSNPELRSSWQQLKHLVRSSASSQAIKSPLEYISQVNHWMLSHDNVWPCTSSSSPGMSPRLIASASIFKPHPRIHTHPQTKQAAVWNLGDGLAPTLAVCISIAKDRCLPSSSFLITRPIARCRGHRLFSYWGAELSGSRIRMKSGDQSCRFSTRALLPPLLLWLSFC